MFLKCASNNQGETVLETFMQACESFCAPIRIRTDHGTENVVVARAMPEIKRAETNPVLTGRSVHNQRIKRLWLSLLPISSLGDLCFWWLMTRSV